MLFTSPLIAHNVMPRYIKVHLKSQLSKQSCPKLTFGLDQLDVQFLTGASGFSELDHVSDLWCHAAFLMFISISTVFWHNTKSSFAIQLFPIGAAKTVALQQDRSSSGLWKIHTQLYFSVFCLGSCSSVANAVHSLCLFLSTSIFGTTGFHHALACKHLLSWCDSVN